MEENPPEEGSAESSTSVKESLFSKFKINFNLPPVVQNAVIPGLVIMIVLLLGGGGTYLVVSNVLGTSTQGSASENISKEDLELVPTLASFPPTLTPTPAPTSTTISEEDRVESPTTTAQSSVVKEWPTYTFSSVFMTFSYPTGWAVNLGATSAAPYLYIQNFTGSVPVTYSPGQYAILVSRLDQVGITTINALTTQLALNDASTTTINGVTYGTATVISSESFSVNGNLAYERTVNYSAFPNNSFYELYILDGVSNVIKFMPLLDSNWGQPYFNLIYKTVEFTN